MADYFAGDFGGPGETLMLVHGRLAPAQVLMFEERLQRLAQDFAQQHLADQKLPAHERRAVTQPIVANVDCDELGARRNSGAALNHVVTQVEHPEPGE